MYNRNLTRASFRLMPPHFSDSALLFSDHQVKYFRAMSWVVNDLFWMAYARFNFHAYYHILCILFFAFIEILHSRFIADGRLIFCHAPRDMHWCYSFAFHLAQEYISRWLRRRSSLMSAHFGNEIIDQQRAWERRWDLAHALDILAAYTARRYMLIPLVPPVTGSIRYHFPQYAFPGHFLSGEWSRYHYFSFHVEHAWRYRHCHLPIGLYRHSYSRADEQVTGSSDAIDFRRTGIAHYILR